MNIDSDSDVFSSSSWYQGNFDVGHARGSSEKCRSPIGCPAVPGPCSGIPTETMEKECSLMQKTGEVAWLFFRLLVLVFKIMLSCVYCLFDIANEARLGTPLEDMSLGRPHFLPQSKIFFE